MYTWWCISLSLCSLKHKNRWSVSSSRDVCSGIQEAVSEATEQAGNKTTTKNQLKRGETSLRPLVVWRVKRRHWKMEEFGDRAVASDLLFRFAEKRVEDREKERKLSHISLSLPHLSCVCVCNRESDPAKNNVNQPSTVEAVFSSSHNTATTHISLWRSVVFEPDSPLNFSRWYLYWSRAGLRREGKKKERMKEMLQEGNNNKEGGRVMRKAWRRIFASAQCVCCCDDDALHRFIALWCKHFCTTPADAEVYRSFSLLSFSNDHSGDCCGT